MFQNRSSVAAFWVGCLAVVLGVVLHLPMFAALAGLAGDGSQMASGSMAMGPMAMGPMAMGMGHDMAGMDPNMPMPDATAGMSSFDPMMLAGMGLILGGTGLATYGLFPRRGDISPDMAAAQSLPGAAAGPPETIGRAQWLLMIVLTLALVVDTMKPATLGFAMPGMRGEYGLSRAQVAWLPFVALSGTVVGSLLWGWLCDFYGRRAAILLATVVFIGTSVCGAMPSFGWNLAMCFMMGASAGGLLPVTYALLTETLPPRSRGWALVLVGGVGSAGGYLAASTAAAVLEPLFTWRGLWLLGLPTGMMLIMLNRFIPESPDFLHPAERGQAAHLERPPAEPTSPGVMLLLAALTLVGLAWGLVNFGLLLWLPTELVARGQDMQAMSALLSKGALLAAPLVLLAALGYARWSGKWTLVASIGVVVAGLCLLMALDIPALAALGPLPAVVFLVVGANGVIATLLPYAAENTPAAIRGRATGWVAGSSKAGGILAQLAGLIGISPSLSPAALFTGVLLVASAMLLALNDRTGRFEPHKPA